VRSQCRIGQLVLAAAGFGVYRTNPAMQDLAVAQYGFNNHALLRFHERLKDAAMVIEPHPIALQLRYLQTLLELGPSALKSDSRDELERMYDRLIDGDADIQPREIQLRRKDGSRLPAEVHRQAQRSGAGWLMVLIIRDLSRTKKRGHKRSKARTVAV